MVELTRENFIGPWAGLPVPWTDDDRFDESRYRDYVGRCCDAGLPGIYTGGTTGEFYAMDYDEFQTVARATVEVCHARDTPVMIGVGALSTTTAMRRAAFAAEIGADAIQAALPFWLEVPDDRVIGYFKEVTTASGNLPLSIYDTTRTKKQLSIDQHKAIKDAVPSYTMVKATATSVACEPKGCEAISRFVNVFADEVEWPKLSRHGLVGSCSARAFYNPRVSLELWDMLKRRDWHALDRAGEPMTAFYRFIADTFALRGFTDAAYDKLGATASGFIDCGLRLRGPYVSPTPEDVETMRAWYREHWPAMLELPVTR